MLDHNTSIISITDTRTNADNEDLANIKVFIALINSRKGKKVEGVGLFLNDILKIKYKLKHNVVSDAAYVLIQIDGLMYKTKDIIIGVIYKTPDVDMQLVTSKFGEILEAIQRENRICYIPGEYNINFTKPSISSTC